MRISAMSAVGVAVAAVVAAVLASPSQARQFADLAIPYTVRSASTLWYQVPARVLHGNNITENEASIFNLGIENFLDGDMLIGTCAIPKSVFPLPSFPVPRQHQWHRFKVVN